KQVPDVVLVARPPAAEDVRIDDHEGHTSSRQRSSTRSAERRHENIEPRARPVATRETRSPPASSMPAAIDSGSRGSTSTAAPPATSSVAPPRLVTTGVPHAIASSTGIPNPSYSDG